MKKHIHTAHSRYRVGTNLALHDDDDCGAVRAFNPRVNDGAKNAELEASIAVQDAAKAAAEVLISMPCYVTRCSCPIPEGCRLTGGWTHRSFGRITKRYRIALVKALQEQ